MTTKSTNGFCDACGTRVDWKSGWCPNAACPAAKDDWKEGVTAPGPVRLPTREEIMADSRRARWHPIDTVPMDRATLITRESPAGWLIERHEVHTSNAATLYVYGRLATHWAEDIVGHP